MNKQEQIQQYMDYGFSEEEAAAQLSLEKEFVITAVEGSPRYMAITGRSFVMSTIRSYPDVTIDFYELLHREGPKRINSVVTIDGLHSGARYLGVDINTLYKLKQHFGYHKKLPYNALNKIAYFTDIQRNEIKERDNGKCVRCSKEATRFFKIDLAALPQISNCAMLCNYCTWRRMSKHLKKDKQVFKGMQYNEFLTWITTNDRYKRASRKSAN